MQIIDQVWTYISSQGGTEIEINDFKQFTKDSGLKHDQFVQAMYKLRRNKQLDTITTRVGGVNTIIGIKLLRGPSVDTVIKNNGIKLSQAKPTKLPSVNPTPMLEAYLAKKNVYDKIGNVLKESGFHEDSSIQVNFQEDAALEECLFLFNLVNQSIDALNEVMARNNQLTIERDTYQQLYDQLKPDKKFTAEDAAK